MLGEVAQRSCRLVYRRSWTLEHGCVRLGAPAMNPLRERGAPAAQTETTGKRGYCHPPQEHRFKPGVSGNPKGRPRKKPADIAPQSSELSSAVRKVIDRPIKVTENGKVQTVTSLEAVLRVIERKALNGDVKAASLYLAFAKAELAERKEHQQLFERQAAYKRRHAEAIHRSEVNGYEPYIPVPDPKDIVIDARNSEAIFNGPIDDVEKADWDRSKIERREQLQKVKDLDNRLCVSENEREDASAMKKLKLFRKQTIERLEVLDAFYPPPEIRHRSGFSLERWRREKGKGRKRPSWD